MTECSSGYVRLRTAGRGVLAPGDVAGRDVHAGVCIYVCQKSAAAVVAVADAWAGNLNSNRLNSVVGTR